MKAEQKNQTFTLAGIAPNIVTLLGLCVGLFALKFAIDGLWSRAVMFIIIAAFIDGLDGRLARMLNASSPLGAQLDSLADFFNFGVAPALIIYLWKLQEIKAVGWAVTLFFIICSAIRLARFNVSLDEQSHLSHIRDKFFTGVPAPMGAALCLTPMMISFFSLKQSYAFTLQPYWVITNTLIVALLMISNIPTLSLKKLAIKRESISFFMAIFALLIIAIIIEPWFTIPLINLCYLCSIPVTWMAYIYLTHKASKHP